jgi:inner membrane protein
MATPIGHLLAGYAVGRGTSLGTKPAQRTLLLFCMVLAVAPDLDFLPGLLQGQPALYHQGISHSFAFALVVGLFGALLLRPRAYGLLATWGLLFAAYSSHLLIDLFGPDNRPPYGIPLFWPLSDSTYLSPLSIFWGVRHVAQTSATTAQWFAGIAHPYNVGAILIELALIGPLAVYAEFVGRRRCPGQPGHVAQGRTENQ